VQQQQRLEMLLVQQMASERLRDKSAKLLERQLHPQQQQQQVVMAASAAAGVAPQQQQ
jgi:hypothetical protein